MLSKTAEDGEIMFRISELKLSQIKIRSRLIGWCFFPFVITYHRPWNEQVISGKFIHLSRWLEDLLPWPCGSTSTSVTGLSNSEEEKLFSRLWSPAQRTSLASTAANLSFSLVMKFTYRSFKMQLVSTFVLFAALMWFSAEATEVKACQGGPAVDTEKYNVVGCTKPPCRLRRKTEVAMEVKFTPEFDVPSVKNSVHALILNIPFPFIGVDGTNACDTIFDTDGSKASCPLKGGKEYVYKNNFKVLEIYPKIKVNVIWSLATPDNKDVFCFSLPARIV